MDVQTGLFTATEIRPKRRYRKTPIAQRMAAMKNIANHAGEQFKTDYTAFVLTFASVHAEFTNEEVVEAYKNTSCVQPTDYRATGSIIAKLKRQGKIVGVGYSISKTRGAPIERFRKG